MNWKRQKLREAKSHRARRELKAKRIQRRMRRWSSNHEGAPPAGERAASVRVEAKLSSQEIGS